MENADIVTSLLKKISARHSYIVWSVKCCFTDGRGNSFHQIYLRWRNRPKEKTITFQMETGKLLTNSCQNLDTSQTDSVIDVLLDILNEETAVVHP